MPIASRHPAVRRGWHRPTGTADFTLKLTGSQDAADHCVASDASHGLGRQCSAIFDFAGRCSSRLCQCLDARPDHKVWPGAPALAGLRAAPADLDEPVGAALTSAALVLGAGQHPNVESTSNDRAALDIEQAIQADQPIDWIADMKVAPLVGTIGFGERGLGIDAVLKVFSDADQLPGIVGCRRPEKRDFLFPHGLDTDMLGRSRQDRNVLPRLTISGTSSARQPAIALSSRVRASRAVPAR